MLLMAAEAVVEADDGDSEVSWWTEALEGAEVTQRRGLSEALTPRGTPLAAQFALLCFEGSALSHAPRQQGDVQKGQQLLRSQADHELASSSRHGGYPILLRAGEIESAFGPRCDHSEASLRSLGFAVTSEYCCLGKQQVRVASLRMLELGETVSCSSQNLTSRSIRLVHSIYLEWMRARRC
jgi:hypothetical protein